MGVFRCGVGGDGGGVPEAPVSLCIACASVCDTVTGWGVDLSFTVCDVVDLLVLIVFPVSVGTDINCLCLGTYISRNFVALAGKASMVLQCPISDFSIRLTCMIQYRDRTIGFIMISYKI